MNCIVVYDIVEDKIRNKIADVCLDFGLQRIQYSAFFGELSHNQKETLFKKVKRIIGETEGNIQIYPVCEKDLGLKLEYIVKKEDSKSSQCKKTKILETSEQKTGLEGLR